MLSLLDRLRGAIAGPATQPPAFPFVVREVPAPDAAVEALFFASFRARAPDFPLHFVAADRAGTVAGYVHYTRHAAGVYLCGGLCVDAQHYRVMDAEERARVRKAGSLSRWLLQESIALLPGKKAVFAYTGSVMSRRDCEALGFVPVDGRFLIVQWHLATLEERSGFVENVAMIGPF